MSPTYGKQFSDLYDEVSKDVGDTTSSFITEIKKKINDVGRSLFNKMNYAWKQRSADITLIASQGYVNMSDVAAGWDDLTPVEIYYRNSANKRAVLEPYDEREWNDEQSDDEGEVYGYHIAKISGVWRIFFVLVPDDSFVSSYSPLKMEYQQKWTELSGATEIPDLPTSHHQLLLYRTDEIVSIIMGDTENAANWKLLADKEEGLLNKKQVQRLGRPHRVRPIPAVTVKGQPYIQKDYNL